MADDPGEQVELSIEIEPSLEPATTSKPDQPDEEEVRLETAPVADEEVVRGDGEEVRMKTAPSLEPAVAGEEMRTKTTQTLEPAEADREEVPALSFRDSDLEAAKTEVTRKIGQPQSPNSHAYPNTTRDGVHSRDSRIPDELVDFPMDEDGIIRLADVQMSTPRPVPRKLVRITKDDDPRLHQHVSRRHRRVQELHSLPRFAVPILAGDDSAWDQVDAALKSEDREDILEKVLYKLMR